MHRSNQHIRPCRHDSPEPLHHRALAFDGWKRGLVIPWKITQALNWHNLAGPEVDIACGTEEPAVDRWEQGRRYPTFDQLCALATLTTTPVEWFVEAEDPPDITTTSLIYHVPPKELQELTTFVVGYGDAVVEACPGTDSYTATHLF